MSFFWCRLGCLWVARSKITPTCCQWWVHGSQPPRCGSSNNWIDQNCLKIGGVIALWYGRVELSDGDSLALV